MDNDNSALKLGLDTAFIDSDIKSENQFRPEFLYNDYKNGRKVISSLEEELLDCDSFFFSVAFITRGGLTPLLQTLEETEKRGIPGKVLTTDYLSFTEPDALRTLNSLSNIEVRMFAVDNVLEDFHTKGYIFKKGAIYRIVLGSSNMTHNALMLNHEWNSKIVSTAKGAFANEVVEQFDRLWNSEHSLPFEKFIDSYETQFRM